MRVSTEETVDFAPMAVQRAGQGATDVDASMGGVNEGGGKRKKQEAEEKESFC